jgi:hypothetical protein
MIVNLKKISLLLTCFITLSGHLDAQYNGITYIDNEWLTITASANHPNDAILSANDSIDITFTVSHDSNHPDANGVQITVGMSPLQAFDFDQLSSHNEGCDGFEIIVCQNHPNGLTSFISYGEDFCYNFRLPLSCMSNIDSTTLTVGFVTQLTDSGTIINNSYEDNSFHYNLSPCSLCNDISSPEIELTGNQVSVLINDPLVAGFQAGYILGNDTLWHDPGTNPIVFFIPNDSLELIVAMDVADNNGGTTCYYSEFVFIESTTSIGTPTMENILIYPNPTFGPITISGSEIMKRMTIFDSFGRLLHYGDLKRNMDLSTWGSGLRFITLTNDGYSVTKKVIVQ